MAGENIRRRTRRKIKIERKRKRRRIKSQYGWSGCDSEYETGLLKREIDARREKCVLAYDFATIYRDRDWCGIREDDSFSLRGKIQQNPSLLLTEILDRSKIAPGLQ